MGIRTYVIPLEDTTLEERSKLKDVLLSSGENVYRDSRAFKTGFKGSLRPHITYHFAYSPDDQEWCVDSSVDEGMTEISIQDFIAKFSKPKPSQKYRAGQIWETRAGVKVLITQNSKASNLSYPIYTQNMEGDILQLTEEGKYLSSGKDSAYDLVKLLQEFHTVDLFRPVVGECWKDLKGDIYEITNIDFSSANLVETVCLSSHVVKYFSSKGTISTEATSLEDLVERVKKKESKMTQPEFKPGQIWVTTLGQKALVLKIQDSIVWAQYLEKYPSASTFKDTISGMKEYLVRLIQESHIIDVFEPVIGEQWRDSRGKVVEIVDIRDTDSIQTPTAYPVTTADVDDASTIRRYTLKGKYRKENIPSIEDLVEKVKTIKKKESRPAVAVSRVVEDQNTNKKGDFMSKVKDQLEVNKEKFTDAAKLKAGQVINQQAIKALKKQLPVFVQGYADKPIVQLLLVNAVSIAAKQFAPDNKKLNKVADLMVGAAAFTTVDSFNIEAFIDEMLKSIKLPEGILDDNSN